ncbi:hypothetical protein BN14_09227 [Rhizoctonia solani AG-1 IB]|uniref:Uncharacterized protein n=1 Tax=Thanatephorus cucumeris (strain AG1-IB / isolate 7/3/14) TaxID=1108050 RepID=M5CFX2_THACB|nr:hypothetical protein BN14_09227 [Rhizoctonia solani AG-1 IB]
MSESPTTPENLPHEHNQTPLEHLWTVVHSSIQNQEYTFWGHTIADEAKNLTRELVYRAARSKIVESLPQSDNNIREAIAASIVARVESIIKKRELNESNAWDEAWDKRWNEAWQDVLSDTNIWQVSFQKLWTAEQTSGEAQKAITEGRAPGIIAGRTPQREVLSVNGAVWLHSILMGFHPSLVHQATHNSKVNYDNSQPTKDDNCGTFSGALNAILIAFYAILAGKLESTGNELSSTQEFPNVRGPIMDSYSQIDRLAADVHEYEIWASPRELAVHMAWEKAWPIAVIKGKECALKIQSTQTEEDRRNQTHETPIGFKHMVKQGVRVVINAFKGTDRAPAPRMPLPPIYPRRTSSGGQILRRRLLGSVADHRSEVEKLHQDLARERAYLENKEKARVQAKTELSTKLKLVPGSKLPHGPRSHNDPTREQLNIRAQEAWDKLAISSSFRTKLDSLAEEEWQTVVEKSYYPGSIDTLKSEWVKQFQSNWENAWKDSWAEAWKASWDEAWDAAVARGAEFGVEQVFDNDSDLKRLNYDNIKSKQAYLDVQALVSQGDYLGCLGQVYSMMKELYRLYESLQHAIPVFRDENIKITAFEKEKDKQAKVLTFRSESRPDTTARHLSYYELQGWIEEHYIKEKFEDNEAGKKLFKRKIAQVWSTAVDIYSASNKTTLEVASTINPRP